MELARVRAPKPVVVDQSWIKIINPSAIVSGNLALFPRGPDDQSVSAGRRARKSFTGSCKCASLTGF